MPVSAILLSYQERIVALHAVAAQLRFGQMLAVTLMIVAIVGVGVVAFLAMAKRAVPLPNVMLPLSAALYAGEIGRRRNRRLLQMARLQSFYQRGVDRLEGRWVGSGSTGEDCAPEGDHPFAKDLQVFGEGSLFELLCTCRTDVGRRHLAQALMAAPSVDDIRRKQEAVRELQENVALREQLFLLGEYSFQESSRNTISEWLDSPVVLARLWFRALALSLSFCVVVLFVLGLSTLGASALMGWNYLTVPVVVVLFCVSACGFLYREKLLAALPAIRALSPELGVLRHGLNLLQSQRFGSPLLKDLTEALG